MTSEWLCDNLMRIIDKHELGERVAALVTDTPNVMKKMWELMCEQVRSAGAAVGGAHAARGARSAPCRPCKRF